MVIARWGGAEAEAERRRHALWRAVEAQHVASTMALVDSIDEQHVLERLLDEAKPPVPATGSQWSTTPKMTANMVPSQKSGTEIPRTARPVTSVPESRRLWVAEKTPVMIPKMVARTIALTANSAV